MDIGEKIKLRRIELGWSQQKLADMMGYTSKSTITKIEKGIVDVSQRNIEKFAEVLDVSIAYLMDWDSSPDESINPVTPLVQQHLENYSRLNPESQKIVDDLINVLLNK